MLSAPVALCTARAAKAWCISTIQGRRAEQEDRFAVLPRIAGGPAGATCGFYAVFDGHGGNDCSRYAAATMHEHLLASAAFRTGDMRTALKDAIAATEAGFLRIAHARKLQAGSTALAAIVCAPEGDGWGELTVAHLGDSRAVLCRAGKAVALTVDHKPDDASERARIEAQGGFVTERGYCMRVQGVLAMSRALGNRLLKPYVSDEPTVSSFPLAQHDSFFVLASDGLYDVFDDSEVVKLVRSTKSPEDASKLLVAKAFEAGSCDNITVIVVALKGYHNYASLEQGEPETPEAGKYPAMPPPAAAAAPPAATVPAGQGGGWFSWARTAGSGAVLEGSAGATVAARRRDEPLAASATEAYALGPQALDHWLWAVTRDAPVRRGLAAQILELDCGLTAA